MEPPRNCLICTLAFSPIQLSEKEPAYSVIIQKGEGYSKMYNNLTASLENVINTSALN